MRKTIVLFTVMFILCFSFCISLRTSAYDQEKDSYGQYLISTIDKRISLDLEGASLIDVLKVLSQQTGLNFVSASSVRDREVTLYLEQVPLKKALDTIFLANNLTYDFYPESNIFIVKDLGNTGIIMETRVYNLQYARLTSTRLDREVEDSLGAKGLGGIEEAVKNVLSKEGRIMGDPRTNSLIVTDYPSQFKSIEEVINSLDVPIPKVLIEVEMLNVRKSVADNLGLNWANGFQMNFDSTYGRSFTDTFRFWSDNSGKTGTTSMTLNLDNVLELLHQEISAEILARPKILTMSGETAEIKLTKDEVIAMEFTYDENGNISDAKPERAETGTSLRVTPVVNAVTDEITLYFEPIDKDSEDSGFFYEDTEYKNVNERSVKSLVVLKDGDTFVIGGLLSNKSSVTNTKVPFFSDIPLIGALFRHKSRDLDENKRDELLIFLTPHIMDEDTDQASAESVFTEGREQSMSGLKKESVDKALASFEENVPDTDSLR